MLTLPFDDSPPNQTRSPFRAGWVSYQFVESVKPEPGRALEDMIESKKEGEEKDDNGEEGEAQAGRLRMKGSHKKKTSQARLDRVRLRRIEANARERNRMHGLNNALDSLRKVVPCYSKTQKLSKIETLRLAKNYIWTLSEILRTGKRPDLLTFVRTLCKGLSQPTTNLVASCLQLSSHSFMLEPGEETFSLHPVYNHHRPEAVGSSMAHNTRLLRSFGSLCSPHETLYDSPSPDCSSYLEAGTLSPPLNFNRVFSLKHEKLMDYRNCHYGLRYCSISQRSPVELDSCDIQLQGQFYPVQEKLNKPFHN